MIEGADALGDRLGAMWDGVVVGTSDDGQGPGDGEWLLLEIELWLHAVRDPELGMVGAERFGVMRDGLAGALVDWADRYGFEPPAPAKELATQLIGLLLGAAFQHRLDPAAVPQTAVVGGLQRLLGLPAPAT